MERGYQIRYDLWINARHHEVCYVHNLHVLKTGPGRIRMM